MVRLGAAGYGKDEVRCGRVWFGGVRSGLVSQGEVRMSSGMAWLGEVQYGEAW